MITEPKIERRKKQDYVAIRMAVPIPFGKYLQPAWNEVYEWMMHNEIKPSGLAIIRYLTTECRRSWISILALPLIKLLKEMTASSRTFCLPAVTLHFYTPVHIKAKVSLKPPLPC